MKKRFSIFGIINGLLLITICISIIYPFLTVMAKAFSSPEAAFSKLTIVPEKFTFLNFKQVFQNEYILSGFYNSIFRTVVGSFASVVMTIFAAYPLSKKYFPNRNFWTAFIVATMFFNAGLVPNYLWIQKLGLMNNVLVLILPGLISAYNVVIARNFFMSLPEAIEESARVDGANDIYILWRIIIPLSMPIIATLALWIAVANWNAWFDSMLYLRDAEKQVLQVVMRRIVLEGSTAEAEMNNPELATAANPESLKSATILVTTIPILVVYPFVQKHFVKGVMIGSVKG